MAQTRESVSDIKLDKVVVDNAENLKNWATGSSRVDNWKLITLTATGVLAPRLPFMILLMYGIFKLAYGGVLELEEGKHFETETLKVVEEDEDEDEEE